MESKVTNLVHLRLVLLTHILIIALVLPATVFSTTSATAQESPFVVSLEGPEQVYTKELVWFQIEFNGSWDSIELVEWDYNNDGVYDDVHGDEWGDDLDDYIERYWINTGSYFLGLRITDYWGYNYTDSLNIVVKEDKDINHINDENKINSQEELLWAGSLALLILVIILTILRKVEHDGPLLPLSCSRRFTIIVGLILSLVPCLLLFLWNPVIGPFPAHEFWNDYEDGDYKHFGPGDEVWLRSRVNYIEYFSKDPYNGQSIDYTMIEFSGMGDGVFIKGDISSKYKIGDEVYLKFTIRTWTNNGESFESIKFEKLYADEVPIFNQDVIHDEYGGGTTSISSIIVLFVKLIGALGIFVGLVGLILRDSNYTPPQINPSHSPILKSNQSYYPSGPISSNQTEVSQTRLPQKEQTQPEHHQPEPVPDIPMATIQCPGCQGKMKVPKLGKIQSVKCENCGLEGKADI